MCEVTRVEDTDFGISTAPLSTLTLYSIYTIREFQGNIAEKGETFILGNSISPFSSSIFPEFPTPLARGGNYLSLGDRVNFETKFI
jgi:hypothetical protein